MMKKILLLTAMLLFCVWTFAQESQGTLRARDLIVTTEGQIIQGIVKEVNDVEIKYYTIDMRENGPTFSIPAGKVYAINYSSGTTQFITPRLNGRRVAALSNEPDTTWNYLIGNLSRGVARFGIGFLKSYSSWSNTDDFEVKAVSPGFNGAYHFQFSRLLQAGVMLSFAQYEYSRDYNSPYDGIGIAQRVNENLWALGLFARYELTQTFVRPYLLGGVNLVFSNGEIVSDLSTNSSQKSVRSEVPFSGFQPAIIARAGIDLRLSTRFGIYGDIGTGLHLAQVGFIFILED